MYQYPDYLMHYGVRGMKWGRRRERRASKKADKVKRQYSRDINKFETFGKENVSYGKMTNDSVAIRKGKSQLALANYGKVLLSELDKQNFTSSKDVDKFIKSYKKKNPSPELL